MEKSSEIFSQVDEVLDSDSVIMVGQPNFGTMTPAINSQGTDANNTDRQYQTLKQSNVTR